MIVDVASNKISLIIDGRIFVYKVKDTSGCKEDCDNSRLTQFSFIPKQDNVEKYKKFT